MGNIEIIVDLNDMWAGEGSVESVIKYELRDAIKREMTSLAKASLKEFRKEVAEEIKMSVSKHAAQYAERLLKGMLEEEE